MKIKQRIIWDLWKKEDSLYTKDSNIKIMKKNSKDSSMKKFNKSLTK